MTVFRPRGRPLRASAYLVPQDVGFTYDANDNLATVTRQDGSVVTFTYDAGGNINTVADT